MLLRHFGRILYTTAGCESSISCQLQARVGEGVCWIRAGLVWVGEWWVAAGNAEGEGGEGGERGVNAGVEVSGGAGRGGGG